MEDSEDRGGYYRAAKRFRTEEETAVKELEDGEENEDSAGGEAAGSGGAESRRSGGKVRAVMVSGDVGVSHADLSKTEETVRSPSDVK